MNMRVGLSLAALLGATAALQVQSAAFGGGADSVETRPDTVIVTHGRGGSGGSGGGGSSGGTQIYRDCVDNEMSLIGADGTGEPFIWRTCIRIDTGQEEAWAVDIADAAAEDPTAGLVEQAMATIVIAVPDVDLSPPHGGIQLVGVPVWVWSNNHHPVSVTASIPTLSATLTATPGNIQVDLGDGTKFTCRGGGVRYDRNASHKGQRTDCSEAYERHGQRNLTVTVVWSLDWWATNGQSGTLPAVTRTTTLPLNIQQAQAVTS